MSERDPHAAVEFLIKNAGKFAQAKANRVYIENFLRSKKSLLMAEIEGSIAAKEAYAYAHPEYRELLEGLRAAVEAEETLKWKMTAAELSIDVWRSQEASNRRQERVTT